MRQRPPSAPASSRRRCLVVGALACVAAAPRGARSEEPVRIARLQGIPDQAVGAEILQVAYAHAGVPIEFVDMPAKRSLEASSTGQVDGEVQRILQVQDQYPTLIAVHPSMNFIEPCAFVARPGLRVDGWASLAGHRIGIVRGVGSSEAGTRGRRQVEAVTSMDQLMQMVAAGRVDVAVNDRFSGLLVTRRLHLDTVRPLAPPLAHIPLYHFLNERRRDLVPRIGAALQAMTDSGELDRVRRAAMARLLGEPAR